MNNSMQRFCRNRGRYLHVSQQVHWTTRRPNRFVRSTIFVDTAGTATVMWPELKGVTFNAGINRLKREGAYPKAIRAVKQAIWQAKRG